MNPLVRPATRASSLSPEPLFETQRLPPQIAVPQTAYALRGLWLASEPW